MKSMNKFYQLQNEKFYRIFNEASLGLASPEQKVFYVDANHSNASDSASNPGTDIRNPLATIDNAINQCTAGKGDIIIVLPTHTETVTTQISLDVSDVTILGVKRANKRPVITGNGTIDVIDISAAGCSVIGLQFAAPGTDAQTADINVDAANCAVIDTVHIGSTTAKNKVDIITLTANADDVLIDGVRIYNTVVEVVGGIVFEGALTNAEVRNCFVFDSIGFTGGSISDEATATGLYIHHNVFANAKADTVVAEFGNNSTGVMSFNHINGRHSTLASNVTTGTGMNFFENRVVEQAALNGAIIPVADTD